MTTAGDNPYLRDAVLTATPEQLQLMLFDGAIRFASQARDAIGRGAVEQSYDLLTRAQNIVREMENGLRHEVSPELCAQMASLYRFVFSKLVDANVHKDLQALEDALQVLRHQRETWAILLDKIQNIQAHPDDPAGPPSPDEGRLEQDSISISIEG